MIFLFILMVIVIGSIIFRQQQLALKILGINILLMFITFIPYAIRHYNNISL